jgi:hypothetical protein
MQYCRVHPNISSHCGFKPPDNMHRSIFLSPAEMSLTKLSVSRNNLYMTSLFLPRESLVSDIPTGDRNIEKLFYGVSSL